MTEGQCAYCQRTEIDIASGTDHVFFDDAPAITVVLSNICDDCSLILKHSIRLGALALRHELSRMRQLDLFEAPKDRVVRLLSRMGMDAP